MFRCIAISIIVVVSHLHCAIASDPVGTTKEITFKTHEGHDLFGKLCLPAGDTKAVVIYVQTAESSTVDIKRHLSSTKTFNYYDVYRSFLPPMQIGFFSYEGRGVRTGNKPPRYETIDWDIYNTSTLDNKVRDAISAISVVRQQPGLKHVPIFLMGASESTLLAVEAASRVPKEVSGLILYGVLASNMRENFRFIMTDGAFMRFRLSFDTSGDGKVSREEYEADPSKAKEALKLQNVRFDSLDVNKDGYFTVDDLVNLRTKVWVNAIDKEDFKVLQDWAKANAAVAVPKDWFKDHFAHQPMWNFLKQLDVPIGIFHGALDTSAPIETVRKLEEQSKSVGKSNLKFFYFDKLDHSLGIGTYFDSGKLPDGHQAIFSWMKDQVQCKNLGK